MVPAPTIRAWRPAVTGVREVLHAHFPQHAYPSHTHDTWTLLVVDTGAVAYDLDRHEHAAPTERVTLLPPHVPHDGRSVTADGFRKRVVYLDADVLGGDRIGRAADHPGWRDAALRVAVHRLHDALSRPGDELEAESRLALVSETLVAHLDRLPQPEDRRDPVLARRLRELLDAHVRAGLTLAGAGEVLGASPTHLVRAFRHETGITPHRYLTGRRLDLARGLLLDGQRAAAVAVDVGFHDQAHLTRHFRGLLGVTPAAYARSARRTS
jgi:AraC-like DNA-binding protein